MLLDPGLNLTLRPMRYPVFYEMYRDAGSPSFFAFPVRVQKNGEFFSIADMVEDADDRTLERLGLNPCCVLARLGSIARCILFLIKVIYSL